MKKTLIVLFAIVALIGSAGFETVTAQDGGVAAYLVMIANQGTQITNQLTALTRMTAHIDQLTGQFEHLKESALGQIGAITDPIADLVAVPTDLLNTTRDWHSDFTGQAGSLVTALTELSDGTSLSESWRDVLQEADTVTEADIRNVYPGSADRAVAVFQRRRDYADRSVVLAHARADAAASLAATAAEVTRQDRHCSRGKTMFPTRRCNKRYSLEISRRDNSLAALAQMEAMGRFGSAAADAYNAEVARREAEARRLADRAALEAQWAEEQGDHSRGGRSENPVHVRRLSDPGRPGRELTTMMKKRVITWTLLVALTVAVPAFGIFGIPSPEDLLIWFVLRPIMHGNQRAMIANQLEELRQLVEQLQTARSQLTHVTDSVQGLVGPIADPIADLVAAPTDLLNTARDWHSDFTGPAGDMVTSLRDLTANGESFSRSWQDVLGAADTVTEADIRNVYPGSADSAVATFQRRRDYADRSLEYAGARADAGADLVAVHQATTAALGRIGERIDTDPDTGGPNRSSAALTEGDVLGSLAEIRTLIAIGRSRAAAATQDAAARFRQEELRRGYAARRLADRAALEAQWAEEQATIAAAADQRIQSMYGGFQIPAGLGGNRRP